MSISLNLLIHFIVSLNAAIDTGRHRDVSVREVEKHIEAGDLSSWLFDRLGRDWDLAFSLSSRSERELTQGLQEILKTYRGHERRKWGVARSGLCLLVAWTAELIRKRRWE